MNILLKEIINKPIDQVWQVAAVDFAGNARWMSAVPIAHEKQGGTKADSSPTEGRLCEIQARPDGLLADETITRFDAAQHIVTWDVYVKNAPALLPIKKNVAEMRLRPLSPESTEVTWEANPELKTFAYLMYPLVKAGLAKTFKQILEELKYFMEEGKQHPRKVAADKKFGVANT